MSCRTLIWILALASPAVATPALLTQNRSIPIQVSCGFDVTGLALVAGKLGTSFYKVQENCRNPQTDRERRNCASQITVMLAFAGIAASFTSAAASDCAASLSEPAECAISTTGFVGILNFVASAAIALKGACIEDLKPLWKEFLEPSPRRLRGNTSDDLDDFPDLRSLEMRAAKASNTKGVVALQKLPANAPQVLDHELYHKIRDLVAAREKRQVKVADCVFDSGLSAMFLGRGRENHGMFDSSFGDSIDLHLSCDPDRCFRLGMSGQVECCGNLCQGHFGADFRSHCLDSRRCSYQPRVWT